MWYSCVFYKVPNSDDFNKIGNFSFGQWKRAEIDIPTRTFTKWKLVNVVAIPSDSFEQLQGLLKTLSVRPINPAPIYDIRAFETMINEFAFCNSRINRLICGGKRWL